MEHRSDKPFRHLKSFQQFAQNCDHAVLLENFPTLLPLNDAVFPTCHHTSDSPPAPSPDCSPTPAYVQEWQASHVEPAIIRANVRYAEDDAAVELLTRHAIEQMGGHAAQYATTAVIKLRQRYHHALAGGWWVSGLDPLNDWAPMDWGQFKPEKPRQRWNDPEKVIKYEVPAQQSTRALFLDGSEINWADVQTDITIPRLWTEGAKKAGAALTQGYAAIALPGVYSGYRSKDKLGNPITPHLIADVLAIAQPGSIHYLAFDQDEKPTTRRNVAIALSRFSQLLISAGAHVRIVRWSPKQGKGIDDLIANHGPDAFHTAVEKALTFEEWQLWNALDNRLTVTPTLKLKTHDLTVLSPESVPDTGIIALAAAKGTGKTNLINGLVADQPKTLLAGHRISLMRHLCERCGIHYRGDLDRQGGRFLTDSAYTLRVGTCVDSLLAIDPDSFKDCDLVLDEVCQVLRHLLTSSTCNQQGKRPVLLMRFRQLIRTAKRVILADADLDDSALRYIQLLRGDVDTTKPFLIRNDYQAPGYPVRFIQAPDSSAITGELLRDLKDGLRLYIATDSKRGSKRIHRLINELQSQLPNLLINSDTSGGETERAFMENPDQHLTTISLQAVTASPSAGTGLSIEGEHFDKVYGLFYGASSTDADMAQALGRVRAPIPRVVWCAKYGRSFSKAGRETSPKQLRSLLKQKTQANTLLIRASLSEVGYSGLSSYDWDSDPHIHYWSQIEAQRNRSMWHLRTALKVRLMHEGHQVEPVTLGKDQQAHTLLKEARDDMKVEQAISVEAAHNITAAEAKLLDQMESLEPEQQLSLQKYKLAEFYCVPIEEVDADMVFADNHGRRRGQLLNLERMLEPETATEADVRALERQGQWQQGYTPWDLSNATLKREMRKRLGLAAYLKPGKQWDGDSLAEFKATALRYAPQIKAALNFTVKPEVSAVQILNQLLEQMGLLCIQSRYRSNGKRVRVYQLDPVCYQQQLAILERRKASQEKATEEGPPPATNHSSRGGCPVVEHIQTGRLEQWRWGTLPSPWVIQAEVGELVTIRDSNGETFLASRAELVSWND
ncbi:plasmid replication protein, CyRepA1 family [Synechococcus sp. PCC 7335]|uniref:plasmid replication protein, CyRepA1 family n=1 Tax=Synechococcus sp. (strain ATCC 29403 / PCC 7335) TaxID=91464 RepID=UPI0006807705|nr:plasmid replication protein, CyRepA1 family [Synechococcus sp. PCC 7335]